MSLGIRVEWNDHKKVEDFLAARPAGVSALHVQADRLLRHKVAVEAARRTGVQVVVEPMTELLFSPGRRLNVPYASDVPLSAASLSDPAMRAGLVDEVVGHQEGVASIVTPPFLLINSPRSLQVNEELVADTVTRFGQDRRVRPVVLVTRPFLVERPTRARSIAARYIDAGAAEIDLRITPANPEQASLAVLEQTIEALHAFSDAGLRLIVSHQGVLGRLAVAAGIAEGYVLGIGMHEGMDHAGVVSRRARPVTGKGNGPQAGVYLPALGMTITRQRAAALFDNSRLRTRLACRLGACAGDVTGPVKDPRAHYLHARAHEIAELLAQPAQWRLNSEQRRYREALELREMLNEQADSQYHALPTRGLRALLQYLEGEAARHIVAS